MLRVRKETPPSHGSEHGPQAPHGDMTQSVGSAAVAAAATATVADAPTASAAADEEAAAAARLLAARAVATSAASWAALRFCSRWLVRRERKPLPPSFGSAITTPRILEPSLPWGAAVGAVSC